MNRRRDVLLFSLGIMVGAIVPALGAFIGEIDGFMFGLMAVLLFAFGLSPWLMFREV